MVPAFGTAFAVFFDPLAINRLLAAVAADPQPFGHAPFSTRLHGGSHFGFDFGFFDGAHSGALREAVVGISAESPGEPPGTCARIASVGEPIVAGAALIANRPCFTDRRTVVCVCDRSAFLPAAD